MKKYLSQVCEPSAHKILLLGSLYPFVKELLKSINFAGHTREKESYLQISSSFFTS